MTPMPAAPAATIIPTGKVPRPAGETGDSPQRRAQRMHGDVLSFDLTREINGLRQELSWQRGDRNAKTLVQEHDLRVVLVALRPAARVDDRASGAHVTVHVIAGRVLVHLADRTVEVFADRLLSIAPGVSHEVEALEESAFLLTIAGTRTGLTIRANRSRRAAGRAAAEAARSDQKWDDDGGRV